MAAVSLLAFGFDGPGFLDRPLQVDQVEWNLLPLAPLDAIEADAVALNLVFADQVEAAVFKVEFDVRRPAHGGCEQQHSERSPHTFIVT